MKSKSISLCVACVVLCGLLACAAAWARMSVVVVGGGVSVSVACSATTDFVGSKTKQSAAGLTMLEDVLYLNKFTPSCPSGCTSSTSLQAYIHHNTTNTDNVKVCLYLDDGNGTPGTGDTLVGCTDPITSSSNDAWVSGGSITGTLTCSSTYWIARISDSTSWQSMYNDVTGSNFYMSNTIVGSYTSPPSTLPSTYNVSNGVKIFGTYITAG